MRDALPPAAAETALLEVSPPSGLALPPVAARALPGDTAWRVAQAVVTMANARHQRAVHVPRDHFLLLVPAKMQPARLAPLIVYLLRATAQVDRFLIRPKMHARFATRPAGPSLFLLVALFSTGRAYLPVVFVISRLPKPAPTISTPAI